MSHPMAVVDDRGREGADNVQPNPSYVSYLLRLRRVQSATATRWVASVQNTATGEMLSFPSAEALVRFLLAEYDQRPADICEAEMAAT